MRLTSLVAAVVAALAVVPVAGAWTWPADGPVLRPFVLGDDAYAGGQHRGVDIGAGAGEVVRAPVSGRVSFAGTLPRYGRTVTIRADGLAVTLLHLGDLAVTRDAQVTEGQPVAVAGPSGEVEHVRPYVHLGVRHAEDDKGYVDPLTFLPPRPDSAQDVPTAVVVVETRPVAEPVAPPAGSSDSAVPDEPPAPPAPDPPAVLTEPVAETNAVAAPDPQAAAPAPPDASPAPVAARAATGFGSAGPVRAIRAVPSRAVPAETRGPSRGIVRARGAFAHRRDPAPAAHGRHAVRPAHHRRVHVVARVVRPAAGAEFAHADAPATGASRSASRPRVTRRHAIPGLAAVAAVAALAALLGLSRRPRRKRPMPAGARCPVGRRTRAGRPCERRLRARVTSGCRPSARPRVRPRAARRRRAAVRA